MPKPPPAPLPLPARPLPCWIQRCLGVLVGFAALPCLSRAAEPNLTAIRRYSQPLPAAVAGGAGPSDNALRPGDWAWQALASRVETGACGAAAAASFEGRPAIGRFEAAALLQGCLAKLGEGSDGLRALQAALASELALLRGRAEGLETRGDRLQAQSFSPTTQLSGQAITVVGANRFLGNGPGAAAANARFGGFSLNYDLELALNTSWSGKDQLFLNLRAGNFAGSPFGGIGNTALLSTLAVAFQQICEPGFCNDVLAIDRLLYRWPLGGGFQAVLGARAGQEDLLPIWPTLYASSGILNVFTANGAPEAWAMNQGPGGGLWWSDGRFSLGAAYVAATGDAGAPSQGGIATRGSQASGSLQVGYSDRSLTLAAIWSRLQAGVTSSGATGFVLSQQLLSSTPTDAYGLAGSWQPLRPGWQPALSLGWGYNVSHAAPPAASDAFSRSQSWLVALQWDDVFRRGNRLGMAVGQPVFATALRGGRTPDDGGVIMESWYRLQLSDAISVAPTLFWLSRPLGMLTPAGDSLGQLGALIQTNINF